MTRILFVLTNIIYLFQGLYAANTHFFLPPDINIYTVSVRLSNSSFIASSAFTHLSYACFFIKLITLYRSPDCVKIAAIN